METIENIVIIFAIVSAIGMLAFLDKRYALGLNSGLIGDDWSGCSNSETKAKHAEKDQEIKELKARVATLEKIVTDPAEQLRKEIDNL